MGRQRPDQRQFPLKIIDMSLSAAGFDGGERVDFRVAARRCSAAFAIDCENVYIAIRRGWTAVQRGRRSVAVTIKDVAREARVSVASVSRALNGSSSMTEGTRDRIMGVVARLRYVPHASARSLITR